SVTATVPSETYTLSLHDALPISRAKGVGAVADVLRAPIPEIAEIEYRIYHAGCIAAGDLAGINEVARIGRIGIREHRVRSCTGCFNAGRAGLGSLRCGGGTAGLRQLRNQIPSQGRQIWP